MSSEDKFESVYAELPAWIADATISKCGVDRRDSIISKLIKYVIEPYVSKHRDELAKGEKGRVDAEPLIEAAMRGWKDLPIRPLSRGEMKNALLGVSGARLIAGISLKLSYLTKNEEKFIVIEMEKPPPPQPRPPATVKLLDIWGISNVIIGMGLLRKDKLGNNLKSVNISAETTDGCSFHITNATLEDLEWILGEDPVNSLAGRLSSKVSEMKFAKLYIELLSPIQKTEAEKLLKTLGISEGNLNIK
jgi:hypothetical protein